MRERDIEKQLSIEVKARGGLCEKWKSGTVGWPDRIVLLPDGKIVFVELKSQGKKPRAIQFYRHTQLRRLGFKVYVLDNLDEIGGILDEIYTA